MLDELTGAATDRRGVAELDAALARADLCAPWVQEFFTRAYLDLLAELPARAPAVAVPYNCGTLLATRRGRLIGVDLALIENYYAGLDWKIPEELYDRLAEKLDLLIVSHGHWDHCWIELIELLLSRGKPVFAVAGMRSEPPKKVPTGCRFIRDGEQFPWEGVQLTFAFAPHAYDNGRHIPLMTTRIRDGSVSCLHTADADTTTREGWSRLDDELPDVVLFKVGGVSPLVADDEEMVRTIERLQPRQLVLPMHLNELGHRGTDACRPYGLAYEWLDCYAQSGGLGGRRSAVLFGRRFIRL